jgi:hypothetical protein
MNAPELALSTNGVAELHEPPLIYSPEAPTESSCPFRTLAPPHSCASHHATTAPTRPFETPRAR